jgi:hypothetical protein
MFVTVRLVNRVKYCIECNRSVVDRRYTFAYRYEFGNRGHIIVLCIDLSQGKEKMAIEFNVFTRV